MLAAHVTGQGQLPDTEAGVVAQAFKQLDHEWGGGRYFLPPPSLEGWGLMYRGVGPDESGPTSGAM